MPTKPASFVRVVGLGRSLPDTEVGISWGSPALKTAGQMFAVIPTNKSAEPGSLAVRVDFEQRDELLAADPQMYYVKDHYLNYPCVLVRLARIPDDALRDLLRMGYEFVRRRTKRSPSNHLRQGHGGPPKLHAKAEAGRRVQSRKAGSRKVRSPKRSGGSR